MKGVPASLSRKTLCKELDSCIERMKLVELTLQRWKDLAAAHKTYNDLHSTMSIAITEFVRAHSSSDEPKRQQSTCDGEQKQKHNVEEDPKKESNKTTEGAENAAAAPGIKAKAETNEDLLVDFEAHFKKTVEDNSNLSKLLQIDDTDQAQTASNERSSNKLARSLSRSFSFKFLSWSRSSKVRSARGDAKDGHSSTLKYLCAWEKQLYSLVERVLEVEKTGTSHEIDVAKENAVWAVNGIQQLRDRKLKPHLYQLIRDLTHNWAKNSDCYSGQVQIMSEIIKQYTPPDKLYSDVHHWRAAKELKTQLEEWLACFANYVSSHKAYIKAVHDWATHPFPACCAEDNNNSNNNALPLLDKWSSCLDKLFADVTVTKVIGAFARKVGELVEFQRKEYEHKSRVDELKREQWRIEQSRKTKSKSDKLMQRLEEEKVQYEASRKEMEKNANELVQTGFTSLCESLAKFSKSLEEKYNDIHKENQASVVAPAEVK